MRKFKIFRYVNLARAEYNWIVEYPGVVEGLGGNTRVLCRSFAQAIHHMDQAIRQYRITAPRFLISEWAHGS